MLLQYVVLAWEGQLVVNSVGPFASGKAAREYALAHTSRRFPMSVVSMTQPEVKA